MPQFDLEDRSLRFAQAVRDFVKRIPRHTANFEDGKQVIRSSGSVGANYIEANEALGTKDFILRSKIARKEAKESRFWLKLLDAGEDVNLQREKEKLIQESTELMLILNAIIKKVE